MDAVEYRRTPPDPRHGAAGERLAPPGETLLSPGQQRLAPLGETLLSPGQQQQAPSALNRWYRPHLSGSGAGRVKQEENGEEQVYPNGRTLLHEFSFWFTVGTGCGSGLVTGQQRTSMLNKNGKEKNDAWRS